MVRPRGWHLEEKHLLVDGQPVSASLFDFGLYFFHNARRLLARGTGPYFYLPKMESHLEARLWNDVFRAAQEELELPAGTIRATVLIETILAAFEMDEILWELRDHSAGLNCGRWDYIFSFIKKFRERPDFVLPDRALVTMTRRFLRVLHAPADPDLPPPRHPRDGRHGRADPDQERPRGERARHAEGRRDKRREVLAGHDGTWVAHPGLVPVARRIFDEGMPARTRSTAGRSRRRSARPTCSRSRRERSPRRACGRTSTSACSTSRPGCAAPAACRSTT